MLVFWTLVAILTPSVFFSFFFTITCRNYWSSAASFASLGSGPPWCPDPQGSLNAQVWSVATVIFLIFLILVVTLFVYDRVSYSARGTLTRLTGEVFSFNARTEARRLWFTGGPSAMPITLQVWNFRVRSFDEAGAPSVTISVEMRAQSFQGAIKDGDRVTVEARFVPGEVVQAQQVYNESQEIWVTSAGARAMN